VQLTNPTTLTLHLLRYTLSFWPRANVVVTQTGAAMQELHLQELQKLAAELAAAKKQLAARRL